MWRTLGLALLRLACIMLLAGLLGGTLIRIAPGFAADERQLDSNLSSQSIQAVRQERLAGSNIPRFYARYLASLVRGDLGTSQMLNQPVRDLLRDRLPITLRNLALAAATQLTGSRLLTSTAEGLSGTFISTPAAVLALLFVLLRLPPELAAALLVFPKIYRYCHNLLQQGYDRPHVLTALAKGAGRWRVLLWHVAPVSLPQILALLGVSISLAIGVLLPIEAICDVSGIGQLAWQAATGRDLPLLVNLTLVVTFLTASATIFSDLARKTLARGEA